MFFVSHCLAVWGKIKRKIQRGIVHGISDAKIRSLKPTGKLYKVAGRHALYVAVTAVGAISFCYNYRIDGRQEALTFGT